MPQADPPIGISGFSTHGNFKFIKQLVKLP